MICVKAKSTSYRKYSMWKYSIQVDVGGSHKAYVYLKYNYYNKVVKSSVF